MKIETKEYTLTEASLLSHTKQELMFRHKYHFIFLLILLATLIGYGTWRYVFEDSLGFFINWTPLIVIIAVWTAYLYFFLPKYMSQATYMKNQLIKTKYTFDDMFIQQDGEDGSIFKYRWDKLSNIVIRETYIMFYQNSCSAFLLPMEEFKSKNDRDAILDKINKIRT